MGPVGSRKRAARLGCAVGTAASKVLIILACLRSPTTDLQHIASNYGVVRGRSNPPTFGKRATAMRGGLPQEDLAILLPQRSLEDFACCCMRYFGHKSHIIGQPPVCHLPS